MINEDDEVLDEAVEEPSAEEVVDEILEDEGTETAPVMSKDEEQARKFGWKPKEEYEGNSDDWKTAKQFNDHARMITQIKTQEKDLENLKKYMHLNQKQAQETALEQARRELADAKEVGDFDAYEEARQKHVNAEKGLADVTAIDNQEIERMFAERNKDWFDQSNQAQLAEVYQIAKDVVADYPSTTVMKAMEIVERRVLDNHPEYRQKNTRIDKPIISGSDSAVNRGVATNPGNNKSFNSLPVNLQREYEQLRKSLERAKIDYTKEEYVQGLKDTGAI